MSRLPLLAALFASLVVARASEPHPSLPPPVIPDCLGVNIHFTDPKPGELEMLAAAGFKWVRMDFGWGGTERVKGEYDFSAFDRLAAALDKFKMRAVFILDYGNPLYANPGETQPFTARANTPEFKEAFTKWAVAAVQHFKGRGYLWEMWNEPNGGFWKSADKTGDYIALAKATGEALRGAGLIGPKGEAFIGPATSTIDLPYLEACFKAGLLDYWDAVSVHPYRQNAPETVEDEYRSLRLLIHQYAPKDKVIPIISGEWGYSSAWNSLGKDETARAELQGKYLPREFLTNIANDVALSIWYDWHDDGADPKEGEHRFGIVSNEYHAGRDPVYDPKPAYNAMKALTENLRGMRFNKRILVRDQSLAPQPETRALIFSTGKNEKVALWTNDPRLEAGTEVLVPVTFGKFHIAPIDHGSAFNADAGEDGLALKPAELGLVIVQPEKPNDFLRVAAASLRLPLDFVYHWPGEPLHPIPPGAKPAGLSNAVESSAGGVDEGGPHKEALQTSIVNPLKYPLRFPSGFTFILSLEPGESFNESLNIQQTDRTTEERHEEYNIIEFKTKQVLRLEQATTKVCTNPLAVEVFPNAEGSIPIRLSNPSGEPLLGVVAVYGHTAFWERNADQQIVPLQIKEGEREKVVQVPAYADLGPVVLTVVIHQDYETDHARGTNAAVLEKEFPAMEALPALKAAKLRIREDGDPKVKATNSIEDALPAEGPSMSKAPAMRLQYRFEAGWKFLQASLPDGSIAPLKQVADEPRFLWPTAFGLWLYGDAQGCQARLRFTDSTGQTLQADGPKIDWKGWRYVTFPMQSVAGKTLAHWGGANDGTIHYPIKWDSIFLLDNVSRQSVEGEIYLSAPTLIY